MPRCCVHFIVGYRPCGEEADANVTITTDNGKLDIDLCQEHLDMIKQGIQETGCIPIPEYE
jgi:hypothetical protein